MGNGCNPSGFILQAQEAAVISWWVSEGVGSRMQRIQAKKKKKKPREAAL